MRINKDKSNNLPYQWKFKDAIDAYIAYQNEKRAKRKKGEKAEIDFGNHSPLINFVRRLENLAENKPNRYWSMRDKKYRYTQKGKLMLRKIKNLLLTPAELKDNFSNRQNQQTAWIGKIVMDWCKDICPNGVIASQGELTAYLRRELQFDKILPRIRLAENKPLYDKDNKEIDGATWHLLHEEDLRLTDTFEDKALAIAWEELKADFEKYKRNLPPENRPHTASDEEKTFRNFCREQRMLCSFYKRCDHRHHAVDAAVIGLCSRSMVKRANEHHGKYGTLDVIKAYDEKGTHIKEKDIAGFEIPDIPHCAKLIQTLQQRLTNYVVWHKPDHFPSGAFFDQTAYNVHEEKDGKEGRFIRKAPLEKFLKSNNKLRTPKELLAYLSEVLYGDTLKQSILEQLEKRLEQGMNTKDALCGTSEDDGMFYRGNKVKKVRYMYKEKHFVTFANERDIKIIHQDKGGVEHKKFYQNAGFACADFDEKTGKLINTIPIWKYLENKQIPQGVMRIFIEDILFDKKAKMFYVVKQFNATSGIKLLATTEYKGNLKSKADISDFVVVKNRQDIAKIKKEYGITTPN